MRKELIGAVSALALMSGAALAQQSSPSQPGTSGTEGATSGATSGSASPQAGQGVAMDRASASQLLGKTVVGSDGQSLGEVEDVVLDPQSGQAKQVIISSGGFLGIGEKQIAVDFQNLRMQPGQDQVTVSNLSQRDVEAQPTFNYSSDTVSLNREGGSQQPPSAGATGSPPPPAGGAGGSSPAPGTAPSPAPGGSTQ